MTLSPLQHPWLAPGALTVEPAVLTWFAKIGAAIAAHADACYDRHDFPLGNEPPIQGPFVVYALVSLPRPAAALGPHAFAWALLTPAREVLWLTPELVQCAGANLMWLHGTTPALLSMPERQPDERLDIPISRVRLSLNFSPPSGPADGVTTVRKILLAGHTRRVTLAASRPVTGWPR